jgi:hypothetical protein
VIDEGERETDRVRGEERGGSLQLMRDKREGERGQQVFRGKERAVRDREGMRERARGSVCVNKEREREAREGRERRKSKWSFNEGRGFNRDQVWQGNE